MFKKFFIYTLFLFFSLNCFAKNQTIQDIENYLNNIKYLKANFLQDDKADSELVEGVLYISRPGKLRLDYLNPFEASLYTNNKLTIYYDKEVEYKGAWYNEESFVAARDKFENKLKEKEKRFYKLSEMKDSIEFFKLDEEACAKLNDEISYIEEDIEELKSKIYICQFMIDLLDYYKYDKKFYKEIKCFICID